MTAFGGLQPSTPNRRPSLEVEEAEEEEVQAAVQAGHSRDACEAGEGRLAEATTTASSMQDACAAPVQADALQSRFPRRPRLLRATQWIQALHSAPAGWTAGAPRAVECW